MCRGSIPAGFAALLGNESHGRWLISPAATETSTRRRYRADTLILETDFETAGGIARVIDFMTPRRREPDVIRIVEGIRGEVPMQMELVIRFDYGSIVYGLEGPVDRWRQLRANVHDEVCRQGFDTDRNTFTQYYGSQELDASLLMIPLVGILAADDPRVIGTVRAIERNLVRNGYVQRYQAKEHIDGLPPGEGVFLACTFWLADNYELQGRHEEARDLFERVLGLCNDLGLLAEEYDPDVGRQLGNFPQAFSHVMLINTARNLSCSHDPAEERHS